MADLPIYACAGGKIFLSELPIAQTEEILQSCHLTALTPYTITDIQEFWNELRATAKRGYAYDYQESTVGASCIAVPVRDNENTVIASLSFSGIINVDDVTELDRFLPALKEASSRITSILYSVTSSS